MRGALKQLQVAQSIVCLYSNLVNPNNPKIRDLSSARSTVNQAPLPFVDQDVSDYRRFRRFHLSTCLVIPGLQFLKFFPARCCSEQRPQFRFPLLEGFHLRHRFSLLGAWAKHNPKAVPQKTTLPNQIWLGRAWELLERFNSVCRQQNRHCHGWLVLHGGEPRTPLALVL